MPEPQHESQEPNARGLLVVGIILTAAILIAVGVSLGLMQLFGGFASPRARVAHHRMPEPRLEAHPLADRARYEARQRAKMAGYEWIDRSKGVVRIPIARAMQVLAEPKKQTSP